MSTTAMKMALSTSKIVSMPKDQAVVVSVVQETYTRSKRVNFLQKGSFLIFPVCRFYYESVDVYESGFVSTSPDNNNKAKIYK